jgi:hypothetical protein
MMLNFFRSKPPALIKPVGYTPTHSKQYDWLREAADHVGSNRELRASIHIELDARGVVVMVCPIGGLSCAVRVLAWEEFESASVNPLPSMIESAVGEMKRGNHESIRAPL